jgi:hypothetical protein
MSVSDSDRILENKQVNHVNEQLVLAGWNHHMNRSVAEKKWPDKEVPGRPRTRRAGGHIPYVGASACDCDCPHISATPYSLTLRRAVIR